MMDYFPFEQKIELADFVELCEKTTSIADYPFADGVEKNILIYSQARLVAALEQPSTTVATKSGVKSAIKHELARCLKDGPGVFVIKDAYPDHAVIDRSTDVFNAIIQLEKVESKGAGDHFGENERIWNAHQKACLYDPDLFIEYYKNPLIRLASEAWLGPHYQVTAQVNNVKPGSKHQISHRDYHLGFQSDQTVAQYPLHAQMMSQYLTLQGAVAHCDMPLETGPTCFLPYSQQFPMGYLAHRRPEFRAYFDENNAQIPLGKGDMVFFNPALFHGAGSNHSGGDRIANLLQVSSALGRAMETLDRVKMVEAIYPSLLGSVSKGLLSAKEIEHVLLATTENYSFPTNLDSDPPIGGNVPVTMFDVVEKALGSELSLPQLQVELSELCARRLA